MKEDRFLTGILLGIALLIIASLVVFFVRKDTQTYLPEDNPKAIVHNYIFALQQEDYERAYGYLADEENKPTFNEFLVEVNNDGVDDVQLSDAEINGDTAVVALIFTNANGRVFTDYYEYDERALLILQDGAWKILDMDTRFWGWGWYVEK